MISENEMLSKILSKLDNMTEDIKVMRGEMHDIKEELCGVKLGIDDVKTLANNLDAKFERELTEVKTTLTKTQEELDSNKHRLASAEQRLAASNSAYKTLSLRITHMENKGRMCNVIIEGMQETDGEDIRQTVLNIASQICPGKVHQDSFQAIHRLGKRNQTNDRNAARRHRATMVVFKDVRTRNSFYFARTKLKSLDQLKGIYLNDDVTVETKRARDEYRSVANLARNAGALVRVHDDGLVLDGVKYKLFEPESLPKEYSLEKAKTLHTVNGLFFHSESSFLSNFYPSTIWADGLAFPTAEHRFQAQKCKLAGELTTMKRVIAAPTPLDAKKIADTIVDNAEWRSKREHVMKQIIDEKFEQNKELAKMLIGTGSAKLHEATSHNYFGIGATLHSREVRDMSFKGLNKLGEILQTKRNELSASVSQ